MKRTQIDALAALFRALGDPTRLRILGLLLTGEVCVCHIHDSLRIPQSKTSRHLAYLRRRGLVTARRQGVWMYYRLAPATDPLAGTIRSAVAGALTRTETVRSDAGRLERRTGACLPAPPTPHA